MVRLIEEYQSRCEENDTDPNGEIENELYKGALIKILHACALEDANEHGRLLTMKEILTGLTLEKQLDE